MSILIKGMVMPKDCAHCFMPCELTAESAIVGKRRDDCPLIEVHTPHVRVIDADELKPCPFCGMEDPVLCHNAAEGDDWFYVVCRRCGAQTVGCYTANTAEYAWNRRLT